MDVFTDIYWTSASSQAATAPQKVEGENIPECIRAVPLRICGGGAVGGFVFVSALS